MVPRFIRERFEITPLFRKLVGNTAWLFADRILRLGFGLVISVWISRYLGPAQFGLFSYLIAFVALFTPIASFGLEQIVVRDLVAGREPSFVLGTALGLRFFGGLLVLILSVLSILLIDSAHFSQAALVAIIASGTIVQAFDVIDLWFQSQTLMRYTVYAKSASFLILSLVRVGLILSYAPLISFLWANLAELVVGAVASILVLHLKAMPLSSWRFKLHEARRLLTASWPLIFTGIAIMVYMKIDVVMINQISGELETGLYAAALRLSEVWYFIPMAINMSVMPTIIAARGQSVDLYYQRLERLSRLMVQVALAFAIPVSLFATPLIAIVYGDTYRDAGQVLAVHIWAALFVFLGVAQSSWDVGENLTRLALYRTTGGAVVNVLLNLWLIPSMGALGAAIATTISYGCAAWLFNLLDPRSRPIFYLQLRAMNPLGEIMRHRGKPPRLEETL